MKILRGAVICAALCLSLAGCAAKSVWATDQDVARYRHVAGPPTELVLYTSLSDTSGSGGHTSLLVNASQRVLFDPAGNWEYPYAPERNDVRFGFNAMAETNYMAFQAQPGFHAAVQRIRVSPEIAERALQLALANGAVAPAACTTATVALLRQLPGFESVPQTMFPATLMAAFGKLPGVTTTIDLGPDGTPPSHNRQF